jgi:polyferredoxin
MLIKTKDLTPITFGLIGEAIQTENKNLETILFTLAWLSTFGYSYFKGSFADRRRYENLICPFSVYFEMIVTKLGELDLPLITANLVKNRERVIEFLIKHNIAVDTPGHLWGKDVYDHHVFGQMTENRLCNCFGIKIHPDGVLIC